MTPEEILALIQAFQILEPEVQQGIVGLVHLLAGTNKKKAMQAAIAAAEAAGVPASSLPTP